MALDRETVLAALRRVEAPGGGDLVSRDLVRALRVEEGSVSFVIEAPDADAALALTSARDAAEMAIRALGVEKISAVLTAHGPAPAAPNPPSLKIGGHPKPQQGGPQKVSGVDRIIAIGSGKGGVGKSTVSSNLAVALAKQGRRVGLLDRYIWSVPAQDDGGK